MIEAFLHGLFLSIGLILPIGMQNGFVLTQGSVQRRWLDALPTVVTASLCDTLLIAVAVFGVSSLAAYMARFRIVLGIIGILFLLWMGCRLFRSARGKTRSDEALNSQDRQGETQPAESQLWKARNQIGFAISTSLLNPHAWLDTIAVIGGTALAYTHIPERAAFSLGCVAVSWLWFGMLAWVGRVASGLLFGGAAQSRMNIISGGMMWLSAVYLAYALIR